MKFLPDKLQKILIVPALVLVILAPIFAPLVEGFNFPDRYDLAAILVEQGLYADQNDYDGLTRVAGGPISVTNIKERVDRYATDVQNALPGTRAVVIQIDRFEKPQNIAAVLEKLYFEGDPKEPNRVAYLKGVIVIGEVPLPVVNKKGNRFISLFPYTDFEQKAYVWNPETRDFEIKVDNENPQPEVWHGVIRPPVSTQIPDGKQLIAAYLDKNHLYHLGDSAYANFDKKVFFQDFAHEKKNFNAASYRSYLTFLDNQENVAYMRYTKELFKDLSGPMEAELAQDQQEARELQAELESEEIPFDASQPQLPAEAQNAARNASASPPDKNDIPDIMTKVAKMSDKLMGRFGSVFSKYPNLINDFIKYTGRYVTSEGDKYSVDVDFAVNLIMAKDQYTLGYLKAINTMMENKIDEIAGRLQKNIPLTEIRVEVRSVKISVGGNSINLAADDLGISGTPAIFVNYSPAYGSFPALLNGKQLSAVNSVDACTPYRGSKGIGEYSKLVEMNRAFNMQSGSDYDDDREITSGRTAFEKDNNYRCYPGVDGGNCEGYIHFAGCYDDGSKLVENPAAGAQTCFPEKATDPVFEPSGTRAITGGFPANFDNFKSCADFHEKDQYLEYLQSVDERLENLNDDPLDDEDRKSSDKIRRAVMSRATDSSLEPKDKHPDEITLFSGTGLNIFNVNLGDILKGIGWNASANPGGWKEILNNMLASSPALDVRTVNISDSLAESAQFAVSRSGKEISSVMYHKEPTNNTLNVQAQNMISKELPVDNPRYLTFQDMNGGVQRIVYPNVFQYRNLEAYFAALAEVEAKLNAVPRPAGQSAPCATCLKALVSQASETSAVVSANTVITRANSSKVLDALNWKDMDVDTKHKYLSEMYLDSTKNAYVGETANGYEMAYFNGDGSADHYEFSLKPETEETDAAFKSGKEEQAKLGASPPPEYKSDPDNPFDESLPQEGGYDLFSWKPPPVSPWWERMKEWKNDLKKTVSEFEFGLSDTDFYGSLDDRNKKALEQISKETSEVEKNINKADELNLSKIDSISLSADSNVVGTKKRVEITLALKDKNGDIVRDEFSKATLSIEGVGAFSSDTADENLGESGLQMTIIGGVKKIGVIANETEGAIKIGAKLESPEKQAELTINTVDKARLVLDAETLGVIANGSNAITVNLSAADGNGRPITRANILAKVSLSDPLMGLLEEKEVRLSDGKATLHFTAGKKAGKVLINASGSVFDPGSIEFNLLPGPPVKLGLSADPETLQAVPGGQAMVYASLFDVNGNMVDTNFAAEVEFSITENTRNFGNLSSLKAKAVNGIASVILTPREETGSVNIIAKSTGLTPATITVKSLKNYGFKEASLMKMDSLTATLLGIPAGNVAQQDYLGGWFVMNGKLQAANSLTTQPKLYKKLVEVTDKGGINIPEGGAIGSQFLPANNFTMVLTDTAKRLDLAQVTIVTIKDGKFETTTESSPDKLSDGIYMRKVVEGDDYSVDTTKGALQVSKAEVPRVEIQTNGFLRIFDSDFSVKPKPGNYLTLEISDKGTAVAEIIFAQHFSQDVRLKEASSYAPGVYIKPYKTPPQIFSEYAFAGNSSADSRSLAFYDKNEEIKGPAAPGFAFSSLEDSLDKPGIGFTDGNKFALLFSSGESFGEANRPYASDIGIVLGDPTVKVDNGKPGSFSQDVGKMLYTGAADIHGIINLDYNGDGYDDILLVEGDSKVRLIQNNGGYDRLKDQGYILNIKNGIQDITKADFNNDGRMDIVVAGMDSCRKGEVCIDIYQNTGGAFERHNLRINQKEKVVTLRAEDLNLDGFMDLVFADTAGDIKVLYNNNGEFETLSQLVGNVGLQVDPNKNLIGNVLLNYRGMATKNENNPVSLQSYETLSIAEPNLTAEDEGLDVPGAVQYAEKDFVYADLDTSGFAQSTKTALDLNGGVVMTGDKIRYTITLKNDAAATKQGVAVSDVISQQLELDKNSIKCTDCAEDEMTVEALTGDSSRPYLFKGIAVPARLTRHIVYEAVFKGSPQMSEKIILTFNSRFKDTNADTQAMLEQDDFPDIAVSKAGNPTGKVRYFYTAGTEGQKLVWDTVMSTPENQNAADIIKKVTGKSAPKNVEEALAGSLGAMRDLTGEDSDGDGLLDSLSSIDTSSVGGALDGIADFTQGAVSKLTCSAGCIAMPTNAAFLTPGFFSILGIPVGYDVGMPVFGWGVPGVPPVMPGSAGMAGVGGRFYISPTLTGSVGFGVCLGPYGTPKNCFSFGINILDLLPGNICDKINGGISGAMSKATSAISKVNEGVTMALGGEGGATGGGGRKASGSGLGNYSFGSYEPPVAKSRNIRVPGTPSVITGWLAAQQEEVVNKVFNLPDIYLIYPSADSMISSVIPTAKFADETGVGNALTNVLSWLNSVPLIDIQTEEVLFKIPAITRSQIEKLKQDARQWVEDEKLELEKWKNAVNCMGATPTGSEDSGADISATRQKQDSVDLCRLVSNSMTDMFSGISQNMKALDEWILFPKKLMQFRMIQTYYMSQIIDYLDTIIKFSGGWIKKNIARVQQWRAAVRQIKETIKQWKAIPELMTDYQESCDACKTERYSLKELILKVFMAIPSPPVIPLPKMPDIIVDVSKVQAGLKIQFPDVKFKPEPIVLPKLPRISLGLDMSKTQFQLLKNGISIPVIPSPPDLPNLPGLPSLKLPKLPDLPPPPKIPALPKQLNLLVSVFKKIIKIVCLIKKGFVPTDEMMLKTRIEEITARGLTPVLPIDTLITLQSPTISITYVDQIIITAFTNLNLDFSWIQKKVQEAAEKANSFSTDFAKGAGQFLKSQMKQVEKVTSPKINVGPDGKVSGNLINYLDKNELTKELTKLLGYDSKQLVDYGFQLRAIMESMRGENARIKSEIEQMPKNVVLKAETADYEHGPGRSLPNENFDSEDLALPFQRNLKAYRDRMLSYVNETQDLARQIELDADFESLNKFIANSKSPFIASNLKKYLAASDADAVLRGDNNGPKQIKIGKLDFETVNWAPETDANPGSRLLADVINNPPPVETLGEGTAGNEGQTGGATFNNVGLFFVDLNGESKRLVSYTLEADKISQIADIDIDNDGDADKIYSYGTDVYLKRNNRTVGNQQPAGFRPVDIEFWTIGELLPAGMSPNSPQVVSETATNSSFSFEKPAMEGIKGYEMLAQVSPYFFESAGAQPGAIRAHFLPDQSGGGTDAVYATLDDISGSAIFTGQKRDYVSSDNGAVDVASGEILHPLEDAEVKVEIGTAQEKALKLAKSSMTPVTFAGNIEVQDGIVEIIRAEINTQPAASGMALMYGDKVQVRTGEATVHYNNGGSTVIKFNETYLLNKMGDLSGPQVSLSLGEGTYFAKFYAFDGKGNRSNGSEKLMLAPQVCGDNSPPVANIGKSNFRIAVGKTMTIDASRSFDAEGKVISYWLDADAAIDSDGDGIADNDKNVCQDLDPVGDADKDGDPTNDCDASSFIIGPYDKVGTRQMRLTVRDSALNEGYQDIKVEVITPRIVLNAPPLKSNIVSGFVEPAQENVPITIAKQSQGAGSLGWEILKTPSATQGGQHYTDAAGKFKITDLDLRERLVVRNNEGKIIAEVNVKTGRITILDDRYEVRVMAAAAQNMPLRVGVFLKTDPGLENPFTYVFFVPDVNTDVTIEASTARVSDMKSGVHVIPYARAYELGFTFRILPGDDLEVPGAAVMEKGGVRVMTVDVNGDILFADPAISLRVKPDGGDNAVVFELLYNKESLGEIFVAAQLGKTERVQIVDAPKAVSRPKVARPRQSQPFADVSPGDAFAKIAENLFKKGIIAGYQSSIAGQFLFKPENPINRAEFTQITLKMLCIVPREEAKKPPPRFYDVIDPKQWFYPAVKEGNLRGFIKGYVGDAKPYGPTGEILSPFRPTNNTTWAEAATIVLAALQEEDIIDTSKVDFKPEDGKPWYDVYVKIAQNLKPYLRDPAGAKIDFIITPEEAAKSGERISRQDFAVIADRVLLMRDCYNIDTDKDNLPDSWELTQCKLQPAQCDPNGDLDGDKCTNAQEYAMKTDPTVADTDQGGVADCEESKRGTDPLNQYDDKPAQPESAVNEEGVYILRPSCGEVCPCRATMGQGGDLQPGDIIFAAITGEGALPIYAKSNEEKY
ncbi:S-layer homology domain-containing protein [Candidatus Peregrinibacteria bacterium]|nr:S-layer homology domain-containing protein [Candidatus Peregrinibacteria bacterium]